MSNLNLPPEALTHLLQLTLQDRVTGALIGSALGDTIGLYTEFLSSSVAAKAYPSRRFTLTGPTGPTPFHLDFHRAPKDPGHWTDDTDHALLILLAFLHGADTRKPTPPKLPSQHDLATRLRIWARQGFPPLQTMPLGLGRLVGSVLSSSNFISDPEGRAREAWERTGRHAAPNGSLMRTHVLGLICAFGGDGPEDGGEGDGLSKAEREMFSAAASLSRVTHVDPRCVLSCVIGTTLVRGVVRGEKGRLKRTAMSMRRSYGGMSNRKTA
ncbi:hypothetical protein VTJ04DRAFT_10798 [Mycothermus thermophilus]|uniref:uncharacterized protein n=1 Tax=Humicola insolens TaxID=85995 RepID=UPI0037438A5A